jgi:hypothetical protein
MEIGMKASMNKLKLWWYKTDSIEMFLFATLAFCLGWGIYQVAIALVGRFF